MLPALPDKLSDLLELALNDAKKHVEGGGRLDMSVWISNPGDPKICRVCLAGAVLVHSLHSTHFLEDPFEDPKDRDTVKKIHAINLARRGDVIYALDLMGVVVDERDEGWDELERIDKKYSNQYYDIGWEKGINVGGLPYTGGCCNIPDLIEDLRRIGY